MTVPGLIEAQHSDLGILAVRGEERLHLSGNEGGPASHHWSVWSETKKYVNNEESGLEIVLWYKNHCSKVG